MKLTKYQHACFVIGLNEQAIVIDPGEFTKDFITPNNVAGVVATHQHGDHIDINILTDIVRRYPEVSIFTTADTDLSLKHSVATPASTVTIGKFSLLFGGGDHAIIDSSIPRVHNISVHINDLVYYPGDSFTVSTKPVKILMLPVAAPWMKISEALDFVRATKPQQVIPTHDAILSEAGQAIADRLVGNLCTELGITYTRLSSGESILVA